MTTVACIIQEGFSPFEFGIACEVFGLDRTDDGVPPFDFRVLAPDVGSVRSRLGFSIDVDGGLDAVEAADVVVVSPNGLHYADPRVAEALRRAHERGAWVLSLCTAAFVLADAGLLDGRRATTHWKYAAELAERYPLVRVDPNVLFVQDGRIITSAGTASGIDAALHLLRQEIGAELTNRVARRMVVPPQRDGGQAQFIDHPLPDGGGGLAEVAAWALDRLDEDLSVERLAAHAHMSPRTFARRFKAELGATPAAWLGRQRIIQAQRMLEHTDLGIDAIATACGFGSAAVLRQNFTRALGTTPTAYRSRFSCAESMDVVA